MMRTPLQKGIVYINEATLHELKRMVDPVRAEKGKHIPAYYKRVTKDGYIEFVTPSQTRRGVLYTQKIRLLDSRDARKIKDLTPIDIIRLMFSGSIAVYCSCPDFKYHGFKYMAYNMGYGIKKETRFPGVRNPGLDGSVCKHMYAVFRVFGMNYRKIFKDMKQVEYYKKILHIQ